MKSKKGQVFDQISALGVGIATLAIVLVVVFLILSETLAQDKVSSDANATKAVQDMTDAADDIPGWIPLVVIAVIGAILIGMVGMFRTRR